MRKARVKLEMVIFVLQHRTVVIQMLLLLTGDLPGFLGGPQFNLIAVLFTALATTCFGAPTPSGKKEEKKPSLCLTRLQNSRDPAS